MKAELAQYARKAAEIAAERGHCKHTEEDDEGHVCLAGALNLAVCGDSRRDWFHLVRDDTTVTVERLLAAAAQILAARRGAEFREETWFRFRESPITWNNLPGTSGEDVVLLLKQAAELLEGE